MRAHNKSKSAGQPECAGTFHELPTRPMLRKEIVADGLTAAALASTVEAIVAAAPDDAVLSIRSRAR